MKKNGNAFFATLENVVHNSYNGCPLKYHAYELCKKMSCANVKFGA